ncbi:hypothetical protein D623_10029490 [Myotis brandtii]|uniref:Uncharacterized protein n=1 Tax=Myotis brandtii TaxID=109478 RepID=S7NL73_MYOBR|nr:hypothetical protein D623_10029490 [Myotis brandtii]
MAAPIEETAAAAGAPFCGRREICQHGKPPLRMPRSLETPLTGWSRGGSHSTEQDSDLQRLDARERNLFPPFSRRERQKPPGNGR